MNSIKLKTLNELSQHSFYIPAYQRGYRWTAQEVKDLLNDINEFAPREINDTEDKTWYYLLSIILNIFLESAVNAKKTAGGIEENTLDNMKNDLNDKLLPVMDAWINNYLKPARQLPHYENEIKQFNKK